MAGEVNSVRSPAQTDQKQLLTAESRSKFLRVAKECKLDNEKSATVFLYSRSFGFVTNAQGMSVLAITVRARL